MLQKKLLLFQIMFFLALSINTFVFKLTNQWNILLLSTSLLIVSTVLFGFVIEKSRLLKFATEKVIVWCSILIIFDYALGFFSGFSMNTQWSNLINILEKIIYIFATFVVAEILRHVLIFKSNKNKVHIIFTTILFIFIDLMSYMYNLNGIRNILLFFFLYLLPSITKNILLNYLSAKAGYSPCIAYRMLMGAYLYFATVQPNLGDYLNSTILIFFPIILLYNLYKSIEPGKKTLLNFTSTPIWKVVTTTITSLLLVMVVSSSGIIRFQTLTVVSGSMQPSIDVGDIAVIDKYYSDHQDKIKKGDVLLFNKGKSMKLHRVIFIEHRNGNPYFYTQGDANNTADVGTVSPEEVIGLLKFKIPFIGYPSVVLYKLINSEVN